MASSVVLVAVSCSSRAPEPEATPPLVVFEYTARGPEFSASTTVYADRRWQRSEHTGLTDGRLSRPAMRAFSAALEAAPFHTGQTPCEQDVQSTARYRDGVRDREARLAKTVDDAGRWVPCGDTPDARTAALTTCLSRLIDGGDPNDPVCDVATEPSEPAASSIGMPAAEGPTCDGVDLDVVVACFQQAVAILQDDTGPEGALLERAAATGQLSPPCAALPRNAEGGVLLTEGGGVLRFRRSAGEWDHFVDGSSSMLLEYEISCDCCEEARAFSIDYAVP